MSIDLDITEELGYEDEPDIVEEDPRVDEPPHDIEEPELPDDADFEEQIEKWNDDYLGKHMDTAPSLEFDRIGPIRLSSPVLREYDVDEYRVCLIEDELKRDATFDLDSLDESDRAAFEEVDFDEQVLILVESGWGSGSVNHEWVRIEAVDDGLHLHGYYSSPVETTDDLATRSSVLVVDHPNTVIDFARVSLTTSEDRCVHFNSTEGVVSVE